MNEKEKKAIKRIAILPEFIYHTGGIEKCILILAKELKKKGIEVEIYAGLYDVDKTYPEFRELKVNYFLKKKLPGALNTLYLRWKFRRLKLEDYDGFIIFGFHSIAAGKNNHPNVWWSTAPLPYLYGLDGKGIKSGAGLKYLYGENKIKKFIVMTYLKILEIIDRKDVRGIDKTFIVAPLAKARLDNAYPELKNEILFAPVETENFKYLSRGKYYLSVSRLSPDKNVDKIAMAFKKMPDKNLVICGGGPDKDKILKMIEGSKNIKYLGFVSDKQLRKAVGESIALISACEDEDFSMNLAEGLAAGKPHISINPERSKKGIAEIKTGIFIQNATPEEIENSVRYMTLEKAEKMKSACIERSKLYSKDNYVKVLLESLK